MCTYVFYVAYVVKHRESAKSECVEKQIFVFLLLIFYFLRMEVHHHAHTSRKRWTHYFWEFLMLFLAVFCGFLAEYQLEHKIEKSREKQYIRSFIEDLEADSTTLTERMNYCDLTIQRADSVITVLTHPDLNSMAGEVYYFLRWLHRSDVFTINDRTIVQLRNAGGMRLVTKKEVSDSITSYYKEVEHINFIYDEQLEFRRSIRPFLGKILNGVDYGKSVDLQNNVIRPVEAVKLRSADPETINTLILLLNNIKGINYGLRRRMQGLITRGDTMREFIAHEYRLN
jgi:hypothetical protein